MITWIRPSGTEIETNELEATIEAAESLGWVRKQDKPRRGRPPGSVNKPKEEVIAPLPELEPV